MSKIVLLAAYPVHLIPGLRLESPRGHYATWLPQFAESMESFKDLEIHWVVVSPSVKSEQEAKYLNQSFHIIPRWKMSASIVTAYWRERRSIARVLKKIQPDLVHAWGSEDVYGLALQDWKGSRRLFSMQGILQHCCAIQDKPPLFMRLQALWEKIVLREVGQISCESDWGIKILRHYAPQAKFTRIEYGVQPHFFTRERCLDEQRTAVFVGSFGPLKGMKTLLAAFSDPRLEHVRLVVLGNYLDVPEWRDLPKNIELRGRVSPEEVCAWMSKAWCLVHPTLADTSPNCVKEARVLGVPVVTTPNGGQTQYVEHGKSGWIHEASDVEGLIEGVMAVTGSKESSLRYGGHGRERCRAQLQPGETVRRFVDLYRKMLGAG